MWGMCQQRTGEDKGQPVSAIHLWDMLLVEDREGWGLCVGSNTEEFLAFKVGGEDALGVPRKYAYQRSII